MFPTVAVPLGSAETLATAAAKMVRTLKANMLMFGLRMEVLNEDVEIVVVGVVMVV